MKTAFSTLSELGVPLFAFAQARWSACHRRPALLQPSEAYDSANRRTFDTHERALGPEVPSGYSSPNPCEGRRMKNASLRTSHSAQ
jgi:hypothetical protein